MQLRDYQIEAIDSIRREFSQGNSKVLYVLPTGGGKTVVFSEIARRAAAKKKKVVVFVHRKELLFQTYFRLIADDVPCKIFKPSQKNFDFDDFFIYVAMIQTSRHLPIENFDLAIFDEAHHMAAKTYKNVVKRNSSMKVIGVTATPTYEASQAFDKIVWGPSMRQLIDKGYLSDYKILIPKTIFNAAEAVVKRFDFDAEVVTKMLSEKKVYGDIVKIFKEVIPKKTSIVFCSSVKHCVEMEALLNSFGIVSKLVVGNMPITKRNEHLQMLAAREIDAVVSCDAISEGVDVPSVDACVLLRPTLSKVVYVQQVGRVLRKSPGKNYALIVDLVANVMRHGMPEATFEIKKPQKRPLSQQSDAASVKIEVCRSCFAAFTPNAEKTCPYCGQRQFKIEKRKVKAVKDEIVELVPEIVKPELWQPSWDEKGWKHSIRHLKDDVALMQFAKYKGYKPGWVYKIKQHRSKKYIKK